MFDAVASEFARQGGSMRAPRPATREELARVHTAAYLDRIAATAGRAAMLDPDTFTSPESHEIALLAAGAAIEAAREACQTGEPALALVRPPGHHAEAATGDGVLSVQQHRRRSRRAARRRTRACRDRRHRRASRQRHAGDLLHGSDGPVHLEPSVSVPIRAPARRARPALGRAKASRSTCRCRPGAATTSSRQPTARP